MGTHLFPGALSQGWSQQHEVEFCQGDSWMSSRVGAGLWDEAPGLGPCAALLSSSSQDTTR
jgi:hypothetical protein